MVDKIAIGTIASNNQYYYNCGKILINNFIEDPDFKVFVYTDNEFEFKEYDTVEVITHEFTTVFDFHNKFTFINEIRKRGYNKILYIDSDMILANPKEFITNIKSHNFNDGFSYTRFTSIHFRALLETNPRLRNFKNELVKNGVEFRHTVTPWEDLMYFNFEKIDVGKIENLYETYDFYCELRRSVAKSSNDDLRGEGAVFGLALTNCEFPSTISNFLYKQLKYFRDNHYPAYEDIPCLSTEVCVLIVVRGSEENYEGVLETTVNFYKKQFSNPKYVIVETNTKETLNDVVKNKYQSEYVFVDESTQNIDFEIIKKVLHKNDKSVLFYIENGVILLDAINIKNSFESVLREYYNYIVPFNKIFYLPDFNLDNNDFESKMFIIDIKKYNELFKDRMWLTHEERHEIIIESGLKDKRTLNDLICLDNLNPLIKKRLL